MKSLTAVMLEIITTLNELALYLYFLSDTLFLSVRVNVTVQNRMSSNHAMFFLFFGRCFMYDLLKGYKTYRYVYGSTTLFLS